MIRARLIVRYQHDKDADGNPREEDWGQFDFGAVPAVGHLIEVLRDYSNQAAIVTMVRQFVVAHPLPATEFPSLQRREPTLHVIADWRWSD